MARIGADVDATKPASWASLRPWYVGIVTVYLVVAGLWIWCSVWWVLLVERMPVPGLQGIAVSAIVQAIALLLAAFCVHRKSLAALPLFALITWLQFHSYSQIYPAQSSLQDRWPDFDYLKGLPRPLQWNIGLYSAIALYLAALRRKRRF